MVSSKNGASPRSACHLCADVVGARRGKRRRSRSPNLRPNAPPKSTTCQATVRLIQPDCSSNGLRDHTLTPSGLLWGGRAPQTLGDGTLWHTVFRHHGLTDAQRDRVWQLPKATLLAALEHKPAAVAKAKAVAKVAAAPAVPAPAGPAAPGRGRGGRAARGRRGRGGGRGRRG